MGKLNSKQKMLETLEKVVLDFVQITPLKGKTAEILDDFDEDLIPDITLLGPITNEMGSRCLFVPDTCSHLGSMESSELQRQIYCLGSGIADILNCRVHGDECSWFIHKRENIFILFYAKNEKHVEEMLSECLEFNTKESLEKAAREVKNTKDMSRNAKLLRVLKDHELVS